MRPHAELLTIGNELLKGSTLNTNAKFLGRELTSAGFEVVHQTACRDDFREIKNALTEALRRADLVITSGGLGPTPDDLTRDAIAAYFNVPLEISPRQFKFIKAYYRKTGRKMPRIVEKEAMFPANAEPLFNRYGIALGFYIRHQGKLLVVLPGVPLELEKMFAALIRPLLKTSFPKIKKRYSLIVKTVGLGEPTVMQKLGPDFFDEAFDFGIYPAPGEVGIRIYAESAKIIRSLEKKVKSRLAEHVYAYEEIDLCEAIGRILHKSKKSLGVAESCTGGLLSAELTKNPGVSHYFRGSVTVYHPDLKKWLGVPDSILKKYGAISEQTAKALAKAARHPIGADYGIGITGVAGPKTDEGKPVGLVYLAIATSKGVRVWKENFLGERRQIQIKAVIKALEYLWKLLK